MKTEKCKYCGQLPKFSTLAQTDYGYMAYAVCDCGHSVKTTDDSGSYIGWYESRSKAKSVVNKLWNDFNTHEPLPGDRGHYTIPLLNKEHRNDWTNN